MAIDAGDRPVEARLLDLFGNLGIERAHLAAGASPPRTDWHGLAISHLERWAALQAQQIGSRPEG